MTTIQIPTTRRAVTSRLGALGKLATVTEWERAALVASLVRLDTGHGQTPTNGSFLSAAGFAKLGIVGLKSDTTVAKYVKAWLETKGDYPTPGENVVLPTIDWPPTGSASDTYTTPEGLTATIRRVVNTHGAEVVAEAIIDNLDQHTLALVTNKLANALPHPPMPPAPMPHVITDHEATKAAGTVYGQRLAADRGEWTPEPTTNLLWHLLSEVLASGKPAELDLDNELAQLLAGGGR